MPNSKKSNKAIRRGRPPLNIDPEQVRACAAIQCTMKEMAGIFRCSVDHLSKNFTDIIKEAQENGKKSLRRYQFALAQKSAAMAIWLGKNYLEQKDNQENGAQQYTQINVIRGEPQRPIEDAGRILDTDKSTITLAQ